jgi:hypothetical protein
LKLKKHKSITLLLLYVIVAFNYIIPVLSHHIFKEYIINEVCVQREVIENKCQGNCHLQKQFTESEEENTPSKSKVRYQTQNDFVNIIPQIASTLIIEKREIIYFSIENKLLENFKTPIKPPPKIII